MRISTWAAAAAMVVSAWASGAGAATHTMTFANLPALGLQGGYIEDGISISGAQDIGFRGLYAHLDDLSFPFGRSLTFRMNGMLFTPDEIQVGDTNFFPCGGDHCEIVLPPWDNVLITGYRIGVLIASMSFRSSMSMQTISFGGAFANLDRLTIEAVRPDGCVIVENCSHFNVDNVVLSTSLSAAVPEPSTWALMLLGFAGLGVVSWRRSRKLATVKA